MINIQHSQPVLINNFLTQLNINFPIKIQYSKYCISIERKPAEDEFNTAFIKWLNEGKRLGSFADGLLYISKL